MSILFLKKNFEKFFERPFCPFCPPILILGDVGNSLMLLHFFYSLLWDIPPEKQKVPQLRNWGAFCFSLFPFSFLNVHPVRKAGVGFAVGVVLGYGLLTFFPWMGTDLLDVLCAVRV